jgi:hypothetical protein
MIPIAIAVEGLTDAALLERLLQDRDLLIGPRYIRHGKAQIDGRLLGYNNAARRSPWIVLRDLDDAECAPALAAKLLPAPAPLMCFQLVVRSLEAWLIADAETLSSELAISASIVPAKPEEVIRPKRELVNLGRRSRKRAIREAIVPREGSTANVGPGYEAFLCRYIATSWRSDVAATRSPSLVRLLGWLDDIASRTCRGTDPTC